MMIRFIELFYICICDDTETYKVRHECGFLIDFDIKYGIDDDEVLDIYSKETTAKGIYCVF